MSDHDIRLAAFDWLSKQVEIHGDVLPWALLARGFIHSRRARRTWPERRMMAAVTRMGLGLTIILRSDPLVASALPARC